MLFAITYNELAEETTMQTYYSHEHYFKETFFDDAEVVNLIDTTKPPQGNSYTERKAVLEQQAIDYQTSFSSDDTIISWGELADIQNYFSRYGKRYGLLKEFHENGIC